ncbi:ubiquitin conjugating enzyme [Histoplasma capsulatum H143]|uniref:Ubiquitin conjugating enzyme n=1 Tax=Ajellomyces capsulatus (strain H143) TaxID=544712 RepID=C6H887_AJECH|nr:ubiquitin conjugating enzyme [Histoplasma capsulatum H143]
MAIFFEFIADCYRSKIRNKRLAKLGSQASSTTQSSSQSPSGDNDSEAITSSPVREPTSQRPQINISSNQAPSYPPTSSQSDMRQPNEEAPRIRIGAQPSQSKAKSPDVSGTTTPRVPPRSSETVEDFEDKTLRAVFRVTLDESRRVDVQGQKLSYLVGLVQELQEQGQALRMNIDVLDQALLEAASNTDNGKPMEYLLPCWKRVTRLYKGFRKQNADDRKYVIVSEARRLCMSYCIFAATIPEMFGLGTPPSSTLKPHLLRDPEDDLGLCHDFITEAVKRSNEDETILPAFVGAVEEMSHDLSSLTLNMDYKPYVMALRNLVRFPPLAVAITESELLNTSVNAEQFETATLLGPWFRLSPLQRDVPLNYFSSPKTRDHGFIVNSQRAVRMMQQLLSSDLLDIINQLIRASKSARERVLDWFAASVNLNHKRRALQVDHKTVSSDGFMFNITTCLDQLCEPFMDAAFTKVPNFPPAAIDRIDIGYLKRNPRVNMRDETKINADQHASDAFYDQVEEGTSNFITEIFFLTVAAHHYGSESLTAKLEQLEKDLRHMETQIDKLELERHKWKSNPIQLRMFEDALKKYKDKFDLGLSFKYTLQGILLDDIWQARSMQVMRYVIVWLLRIASGRNFPTEALKLPLPEKQPENFKCLPEYFVDDVVSSFKFIMWSMPHVVTSTQGDELIMLCITFLQSSEYIKNPYLKAGLVTILYRGTWRRRNVELRREGSNMEQNVRQQKEEQLAAAQGRAKSYMQLTNETVAMLKLFTEALADSFTMPEIVQRLADMLDYNLDAMVGPKSANLRVDNLVEYGFKPRSLLSEIVDVYLNLMDKENFVVAVARDGRSYKPSNFEKAAEILRKWALKPQEDLSKWEQLQTKFRVAKEADEQAEEDLGDIPDEFLDPLVYTLMEDPVILPSSKVSIDRSTIRSHLLSDPNDPFNRAPLSIEDVIPDTETKAKIEAFKAERKAAKLAAMTASALETMDTTDG